MVPCSGRLKYRRFGDRVYIKVEVPQCSKLYILSKIILNSALTIQPSDGGDTQAPSDMMLASEVLAEGVNILYRRRVGWLRDEVGKHLWRRDSGLMEAATGICLEGLRKPARRLSLARDSNRVPPEYERRVPTMLTHSEKRQRNI